MSSRLRPMIALALALALAGAPTPASACCDGFWSCAAAIASGGLTCAVEALLNSVKQMKQDVDDLRKKIQADLKQIEDATKSDVHDAGDGFKLAATDARSKYDQAVADAAKIVDDVEHRARLVRPANAPGGALGAAGAVNGGTVALAPTPAGRSPMMAGGPALGPAKVASPPAGSGGVARFDAPCDDATALAGLKRAGAQLQKTQVVAAEEAKGAREKADAANAEAASAADVAKKIAADVLVAPLLDLGGMLDDLIHHPDHLFNPAGAVEAAVKRVTDAIGTEFDRLTAAIVARAKKPLEESRAKAESTEKLAAAAAQVVNVMRGVQKSQTKSNCDKLASLVPPTGTSLTAHVAAIQPGILLTTSRTAPEALARLRPGNHKPHTFAPAAASRLASSSRDFLTKQQVAFKPTPVPGAGASFGAYTDTMFRGLTRAQGTARKNELLAEARRRYAGDPAMLRKMLELIGRESDLRIRTLPLPPANLR